MIHPRTSRNTRRARRALRAFLATASVAFLLSWNLTTKVEASAGQLEASFGGGGKVVTTSVEMNSL